jgi:hypothetical protein
MNRCPTERFLRRVTQHSGAIRVLIGMHICPPLAPNFGVHLEDTPSPPNFLWESIADNVVKLYPNFRRDSSRHYSNIGLQLTPIRLTSSHA